MSTGSACSATHDLSLFKPHLKTSSSTTPSRRSLCLALGPEGLCLTIFLVNPLRSDLLPLSDYILAGGTIRASGRGAPQPPSMGRLSELRALFLFGGQPRVGLEVSGVVSWIVETLRVGFRIPFDR